MHGIKNGKEQIKINKMVDALIIIGCLTYIFCMFYYIGETMFDQLEDNDEE